MARKPTLRYELRRAAQIVGLRPYMVDYLSRTQIIVPSWPGARGRGRRRYYSFGDVVMLRAIARLLSHGIAVSRLKLALAALRKHHPEITPTSLPASLLVTDGHVVYLRRADNVAEDLSRGQLAFAFVLELHQLRNEVVSEMTPRERGVPAERRSARRA